MLGRPPSWSGAAKESGSGLAAAKSALAKAQTSMSDPSPPLTSTTEYYRPVPVWVPRARKQRYWLHALLLLLTVLTTLVVGAHMQDNFLRNQPVFSLNEDGLFSFFPVGWAFSQPSRLLLGIPFAGTLMLILLAHEMGHYLYCKRYGVFATLPFFIPAPTLIGTLGAFIRIRSPIRSRTALFDIGIAKPLVAVSDIQLGYPLIFELMHRLLASSSSASSAATLPLLRANLHPVALAAWVGMFATSLNLLPGGQLDGGHIVFSIAPRAHKFVSRLTILILLPMAVYFWAGWLVWAILLEISSFRHPQVADLPRVSGARIGLAVFGLIMLILTLTPAPFAHSSLREVVQGFRTGR